jgi:hypothetical protein
MVANPSSESRSSGVVEPLSQLVTFRYSERAAARILKSVGVGKNHPNARWFINHLETVASFAWFLIPPQEAELYRRELSAFSEAIETLQRTYAALSQYARRSITPPSVSSSPATNGDKPPADLDAAVEILARARLAAAEEHARLVRPRKRGRPARDRAIRFVALLMDPFRMATGREPGRVNTPNVDYEPYVSRFEKFVRACLEPTRMIRGKVSFTSLVDQALKRHRLEQAELDNEAVKLLDLITERLQSVDEVHRASGHEAWQWLLDCLANAFVGRMSDNSEFAPKRSEQFQLVGLIREVAGNKVDLALSDLGRIGEGLEGRDEARRAWAQGALRALTRALSAARSDRRGGRRSNGGPLFAASPLPTASTWPNIGLAPKRKR